MRLCSTNFRACLYFSTERFAAVLMGFNIPALFPLVVFGFDGLSRNVKAVWRLACGRGVCRRWRRWERSGRCVVSTRTEVDNAIVVIAYRTSLVFRACVGSVKSLWS